MKHNDPGAKYLVAENCECLCVYEFDPDTRKSEFVSVYIACDVCMNTSQSASSPSN